MSASDPSNIETFQLELWKVYNTLDSDDHRCNSLKKNNDACGKKCSTKLNNIFYCKTHFPKDTVFNKKLHTFKIKPINNYLLQDIAKVVLSKIQQIYDENSELFSLLTGIVIELQPKINQKMKFISHIIYGKLTDLLANTATTIRFVRAAQKLKAYTGPFIECKLKSAYAKRKWLSVKYTEWFLNNKFSVEQRERWLPFLSNHSKADDLCDTILMAINALYGIPKKQFKCRNGNELK
jgi:hypothetical protein